MQSLQKVTETHHSQRQARRLATLLVAACLCYSSAAFANHPVLVEGERDFDGDGLLGAAEDIDNDTDQVFGTINAALGMANRGANQNGHVIIVTSGRFLEVVRITAANGDVTLRAAPGVEAEIEAVRPGAQGNADRQNAPGIIVNAPNNRIVTIRNILSRNWTDGILIVGTSRVVIDQCRIEHNRNFGIHVMDLAKATITNSQVVGSGFRNAAGGIDNTPQPGIGISFEGSSTGVVASTTVAGSFGAGVSNTTGSRRSVKLFETVVVFDNTPDLIGVKLDR